MGSFRKGFLSIQILNDLSREVLYVMVCWVSDGDGFSLYVPIFHHRHHHHCAIIIGIRLSIFFFIKLFCFVIHYYIKLVQFGIEFFF